MARCKCINRTVIRITVYEGKAGILRPIGTIPAVTRAIPAVTRAIPAVTRAIPAVNPDIPAVNPDVPAVNPDIPAVNSDIPAVNSDIPAVNKESFIYIHWDPNVTYREYCFVAEGAKLRPVTTDDVSAYEAIEIFQKNGVVDWGGIPRKTKDSTSAKTSTMDSLTGWFRR